MTAALDVGVDAGHPEDLRVALARVYETARPFSDSEVHALRAALNIALSYVKVPEPEVPEMVVMFTEEEITYVTKKWRHHPTEGWGTWPTVDTIPADHFYLVCPHCLERSLPQVVEDGSEYRRTYWDELEWEEGRGLVFGIGDTGDFSCDETFLLCGCACRSTIPAWLDAEYI